MAFPTGPSDGQTYVLGTNQFQYDSATNQWQLISTGVTTTPTIAARAADPTARDDGTALQEGDFYYNTTDDAIKTYDGAVWNASGSSTTSGEVGTYAFLFLSTQNTGLTLGSTYAGSSLHPAGITTSNWSLSGTATERYLSLDTAITNTFLEFGFGAAQSGTWRCMGGARGGSGFTMDYPISLFLRIS